jgi:hypothetical protein
MTHSSLFCFGLGYVASHLARAYLLENLSVAGTNRTAHHQAVSSFVYQGDGVLDDAGQQTLAQSDQVLISLPPDTHGCPVVRYMDVLCPNPAHIKWVGYLSTTGVYGDAQGAWVDEQAPLNPTSDHAAQRILAEKQWLDWGQKNNVPVIIFRLSGIYGAGRCVFDRIMAGKGDMIHVPDHMFNRIHVDDIITVLRKTMQQAQVSTIYNVADDLPASQEDVMRFAYDLLKRPAPRAIPLKDAHLSAMGLSFYRDSKRVCNEKIKQELGITLRYPTYIVGLSQILYEMAYKFPANDTRPAA